MAPPTGDQVANTKVYGGGWACLIQITTQTYMETVGYAKKEEGRQ